MKKIGILVSQHILYSDQKLSNSSINYIILQLNPTTNENFSLQSLGA